MMHISTPKLTDEPGRLAALYRYEILDTDPEREFEDIIRLVKTVFNVPIAAIALIDSERQWFKASAGLDVRGTPRSLAFCDYTIRQTAALRVEDASRDSRFAANPLVTGDPHIRCYLGVPLTTPEGYNVGSLCVIGTEARSFGPDDEDVLASFARLVVSNMELRMIARRDSLTGALSRGAFEQVLRSAVAAAATASPPPTLLMIDLDRFKDVNDRFGHPAGDVVLRAVADVIGCELRPMDRLGRLGGEEFGVLLNDVGPGLAYAMAERMRRKIGGLPLPCLEGRGVTISCGVAHWTANRGGVAEWIAATDAALYLAKGKGRNRVEVAPPILMEDGPGQPLDASGGPTADRFSASRIEQMLRTGSNP